MDGIGRWMDNVFIEPLWRSVKYEEIFLREHATLGALRTGLARWSEAPVAEMAAHPGTGEAK